MTTPIGNRQHTTRKATHSGFLELHAISCFDFFNLLLLTLLSQLGLKLNPHHYRHTFLAINQHQALSFVFVTSCAAVIYYGTKQPLYQPKSPTHPHRVF